MAIGSRGLQMSVGCPLATAIEIRADDMIRWISPRELRQTVTLIISLFSSYGYEFRHVLLNLQTYPIHSRE